MDIRFNHDELLWDIVALPSSDLSTRRKWIAFSY